MYGIIPWRGGESTHERGLVMSIIEVDRNDARAAESALKRVPAELIRLGSAGYPRPIKGADAGCIRCGHCVTICPSGSITHREMAYEQCLALQRHLRVTPEQCEHLVKSRRSVRTYKDEPVPREVLSRLIDVARYAPTGHNSQCVEWLVIANGRDILKLRETGMEWMRWMMTNQPDIAELLTLKPMLRGMEAGGDPFLRGAPVLIVTHAHEENPFAAMACPIALTTFDLFANTMGIGCCWAGLFTRAANSFPPMALALGLPPGHKPFASMMAGYPKYDYQRVPLRNAPRITWRQ